MVMKVRLSSYQQYQVLRVNIDKEKIMYNVAFQFKIEDEDGEEQILEVECYVSAERDPFGTGDSPTEYEIEDMNLNGYDYSKLHSHYRMQIDQKAIEVFKESYRD